jgi:hypothetical protein
MTFINGVLLGSSGALSSVLGLIVFFRWLLVSDPTLDHGVVRSELPLDQLLRDMLIFGVLASLSLAAFIGELRGKRWRLLADWLMSMALVGVVIFFFAAPELLSRDFAVLLVVGIAAAVIFGLARRLGLLEPVSRWLGD